MEVRKVADVGYCSRTMVITDQPLFDIKFGRRLFFNEFPFPSNTAKLLADF
jgi:hypothetical protein